MAIINQITALPNKPPNIPVIGYVAKVFCFFILSLNISPMPNDLSGSLANASFSASVPCASVISLSRLASFVALYHQKTSPFF